MDASTLYNRLSTHPCGTRLLIRIRGEDGTESFYEIQDTDRSESGNVILDVGNKAEDLG